MEREAIVEARREAERLMATAKVELKAAYEARQEAADAREAVQRVQQAVEAQVDAAKVKWRKQPKRRRPSLMRRRRHGRAPNRS